MLVNERCLHVLFRSVKLQYGLRDRLYTKYRRLYGWEEEAVMVHLKRQNRFIDTLMIHPKYGKHVRRLEKNVIVPIKDENWGRAMQSLVHIQQVDFCFETFASFPAKHIPAGLFQSVKSVRLVGEIQFSLAKSILNGVSPATLNDLYLDLIPDLRIGSSQPRFVPQDQGEKARIIELAVVQGLLTPLTGRFTALRTLRLRTTATYRDHDSWHDAAWEASYVEWASFIGSVKGTVEKFMCEQVVEMQYNPPLCSVTPWHEIVNERFQRLFLPTIVSGNWTCLDTIELRDIESSKGQGELAKILKAVLGENATVVVEEEPQQIWDQHKPYRSV